jgi:hypothetical protein
MKATTKIYNSFKDIYGNEYSFDNYIDFATFWFNIPRQRAQKSFPEFKKLQSYASNSKEARTRFTY